VAQEHYARRLHDMPYQTAMAADFHIGGHLTVTSRPFIARSVAPLVS
jgi:hypothetical protein